MTLKWLLNSPTFCRKNTILESRPGYLHGWFPLINSKYEREGELGEIELRIEWSFEPDPQIEYNPPKLTAMEQVFVA